MLHAKKRVLIAAAVSLLGVTGALVVPGMASAQSGSRICGKQFFSNATRANVIKFYEVPEDRIEICDLANQGGGSDKEISDMPQALKDKAGAAVLATHFDTLDLSPDLTGRIKCEEFTKKRLFGNFELLGDNFPSKEPHKENVCLDMNRSDQIGDMQAYWAIVTTNRDNVTGHAFVVRG